MVSASSRPGPCSSSAMQMFLATLLAAAALSASTQPATEVTATSATLNGTVDDATTYYFQYGTSTSYGNNTPEVAFADGGAPQAVEAQLGTLSGNTTYHYRVVAKNGGATEVGNDVEF